MPDDAEELIEHEPLPELDGVPDWIPKFLHELRDNPDHFGSITHAARAAGVTYHAVSYWRRQHPAFAEALATIRANVLDAIIDELEHLIFKFAIGGLTETTEENFTPVPDDDGYRYVKKTKLTWDIKSIQWLLERLKRDRYAIREDTPIDGNVTFVFKLGDHDEGASIEPKPPLALPPGRQDD